MTFRLLPEDSSPSTQKPTKTFGKKIADSALEAARFPVRQAVNLAGLAAGITGDVLSLANDYVAGPIAESFTGEPAVPYEKTTLGKIFLPSSKTKEALQSIAPEFLKPKNDVEDFVDTIVEDTVLLFSPGKTKVPFAKSANKFNKFLKPLYISTGANLLGKGVEDFTGGDKEKSTYAKLGSMFLFSLIDKRKATEYAASLYEKAKNAIPEGAKVNASGLENSLNNLKSQMAKGTLAPSEKFIVDEADAILQKIKNGEMTVEEAWASKRSLNEKLESHIYQNPDKAAKARARKKAGEIQHGLSNLLEDYGKKNKAFGEAFGPAEESFATIAKSRFLTKFIGKNLQYNPKTSGILHLFGSAAGSTAAATLGAGGTGVIAAGAAYPVAKLGYRIAKSPALRKHYASVVKAATAQDAAAFNKELKRLDEAIQKEQSKEKYRLLD